MNYEENLTCAQIGCLRKKLGLSQAKLAKAMGVSVLTVSRWELGTNVPKESEMKQLELLRELVSPRSASANSIGGLIASVGLPAVLSMGLFGGMLSSTMAGFSLMKYLQSTLSKEEQSSLQKIMSRLLPENEAGKEVVTK